MRPWFVWGLGSFFGLYTFLLQGAPSVMIPQLIETYGIDVVKIGVLTSSFFYTYIVMQLPAGIFVDLWGPKRVLQIGFLICSISVGWFAYSSHFWEGQFSRMIMGLVTSPAIISVFCLASRWFRPVLFTLLVTLTEFMALAGGVLGEGGLAFSVVKMGWRETMLIIALIGFILTLLSFFVIRDYPDPNESLQNRKSIKGMIKEVKENLKTVLSIRQIWMNGIYGGLVFGLFPSFAALWGVPYFILRYHISVDIAAYLTSMFFIGACLGNLILGWISIRYTKRKPIMLIGSFTSLIVMLGVIFIPNISLRIMFGLMFILGAFCSTYALCFALVGNYVPKQSKGVAMGFTNMLCILFGAPILQPLIGYLLREHAHVAAIELGSYTVSDYKYALIPLAVSLFFALVLVCFVREKPLEEAIDFGNRSHE